MKKIFQWIIFLTMTYLVFTVLPKANEKWQKQQHPTKKKEIK